MNALAVGIYEVAAADSVDHQLVVVARWIADDAWPEFLDKVLSIVSDTPALGPVVYDWAHVNGVESTNPPPRN